MATDLLAWLESPSRDVGIAIADDSGEWQEHTYAELAHRTLRASALFWESGARPGSIISIVLPTGLDFPAAFFGALCAGMVPNPVAPPPSVRAMRAQSYQENLASILRQARPSLVLTCAKYRATVEAATGSEVPVAVIEDGLPAGRRTASRGGPDDLVLVQFTSGSTGRPRGVAVTRANLEMNVHEIRRLLEMDSDCGTASWLPLHHDMGLIGTLLTPIVNRSRLWLMRPEQFLRDPVRFLERMSAGVSKVTAMPSFGYGYIALRVDPAWLDGMDFREWRAAIVGAERIDPVVLRYVAELLGPYGFRKEAFLPAYGLAEATLIVTGVPLDRAPRAVRVDWTKLSSGTPVDVVEKTGHGGLPAENGAEWIAGCGPPIPGTTVTVVDTDRTELPEETVGEIAVRGSSIARELWADVPSSASRFIDGTLYTGDAGFIYEGELFVLGRMGGSVKVRGRNVFVEELEARLLEVPGIPVGRIVVIAGLDQGIPCLLVIGESTQADWAADAVAVLRSVVGNSVGIRVMYGPRGSILRTTSGKPRRRRMWEQFVAARGAETTELKTALDSRGPADLSDTLKRPPLDDPRSPGDRR